MSDEDTDNNEIDVNDFFGGEDGSLHGVESEGDPKETESPKEESTSSPKEDAPQEKGDKKEESGEKKGFNPFDPPKEKKEEEEEGKKEEPAASEDYKPRFESTRKEFLKASRQLADARKAIEQLAEEHEWDEGTAEKLKSLFDFKPSSDSDDLKITDNDKEQTTIQKVVAVVRGEADTFKKYSTLPHLDKIMSSFDRWYFADASMEDRKAADAILEKYLDDPAALTKKVAEVGQNLYEHIYSPLEKAGGLYALVNKQQEALAGKQSEIEKLQKQIDNLKKKKESEEDYIETKTMKLNSSRTSLKGDSDILETMWG